MMGDNNTQEMLEELSAAKTDQMTPAVVYLVIFMIVGTIGNLMVCYFYGCKAKRTSSTIFIVALALYDLLACFLTMPTEIADIQLFYTFTNTTACKVLRFLNYFTALGSGLTLIVIAADRYRMVCRATKAQMSIKFVRYTCVAIGGLAVLFSWPAPILYGSVPVELVYSESVNVTGYDCTLQTNEEYKMYNLVFNGIHLILFVVSTIVLVVLYLIIGKTIYNHKKKSVSSVEVETVKYTMIMLAVTTVYILSFLPYLSLKIWITIEGKQKAEFLNDHEIVAYKIGTNSYLINSIANPLIYGLFNSRFRAFLFKFCTKCRRKQDKDVSQTTSKTNKSNSYSTGTLNSINTSETNITTKF